MFQAAPIWLDIHVLFLELGSSLFCLFAFKKSFLWWCWVLDVVGEVL